MTTPERIEDLTEEKIVEVSAGEAHTLVVNYEGQVLATGSNITG